MRTTADFVLERQELEAMLASGTFDRAPNLAHILRYVCAKYFEGAGEQIKEYNIAVEALGRPPDFDQKRDSIVRVEAHRLRKRLKEFYEADGLSHPVQIDIPPGQYAPRFVVRGPVAEVEPQTVAAVEEPPRAPVSEAPRRHSDLRLPVIALVALVIVALSAILLSRRAAVHATSTAAAGTVPPATVSSAALSEIRIRAGYSGGPYLDRFGRLWQSDRFFDDGGVFDSNNHPILGTRDPRIYETRREGAFSYDIPLAPGTYELRLHFAETLYGESNAAGGGETSRLFNVYINGVKTLDLFDVIADAGANEADVRVFKDISPAGDGKLHLKFEPHANLAFVNAIEVTPGAQGRMAPIRMAAREQAYTAPNGLVWSPDWYASGGQLVARSDAVTGAQDPELFRSERFGNLRYVVPAPPGKYAVTLYFAEDWFGPGKAAGGGVGSRLFDIFCNGMALRRNFDIFREAGGSNTAVKLTFHGITPNAQGKLAISLVPVRNYASIDAIEIVDESK